MALTDVAVRNAGAKEKQYKLFDGDGLFLFVSATGRKWWRYRFVLQGKENLYALGVYPAVSLREARKARDDAKLDVLRGINPCAKRKAEKAAIHCAAANAFEVVAREWHALNQKKWVPTHSKHILAYLEKDLFPLLGDKNIADITPPTLLAALRRIEQRGAFAAARKIRQTCGQIFRYAIATGRTDRDIAADLRDALTPYSVRNFPSITDPERVGHLLRDIEHYEGNLIVRAALRIAPFVFVRPGELRRAEWAECNLQKAEWRIPAARMKMRQVHIVPLARQVIAILEDLRLYTGHTKYLFPGMRSDTAPISDMTLLAGLRRLGYDREQMTVHGFRSMASTLLNELGYNRDWIERQLAHGERNSIRAAYNYAEYLPERRKMMQEWADYLESLMNCKSEG